MTDASGCLVWADERFAAVVGEDEATVGADVVGILSLDADDLAGIGRDGGLVLVAGFAGRPTRLTPLGPPDAPVAFVVEVDPAADPGPLPAPPGAVEGVVALDDSGAAISHWAPAPGTLEAHAARAMAVVGAAVRQLDGPAGAGVVADAGGARDVRFFPSHDRKSGTPATAAPEEEATMLAVVTAAAQGPVPDLPAGSDFQTGLAHLARLALGGAGPDLLFEQAAQVVCGALGAPGCAIVRCGSKPPGSTSEPGSGAFMGVVAPPERPQPSGPPVWDPAAGVLVAPVGGFPVGAALAVDLGDGGGPDIPGAQFLAEVADVLASGLRRLAGDEEQRRGALHDPLTGLPNRALIFDHLSLALARARRRPSLVAVLFIDLERFKLVNDTLGHGVGDRLLVAVSERLLASLRPSDTLARLGGDEFLVVCEEFEGEEEALAFARRLDATFDEPFGLGAGSLSASASIGLALSDGDAGASVLVSRADTAMYTAKRNGAGPVLFTGSTPADESSAPPPASPGQPADPPWLPARSPLNGLLVRLGAMLTDSGLATDVPDAVPEGTPGASLPQSAALAPIITTRGTEGVDR